ncbi:MAG: TetR/AcrR family transcriptional regulator [Myxococcales bacterium]|nr:TetR/AcrR family transcriptional regulator [Myxococcales bacterium]
MGRPRQTREQTASTRAAIVDASAEVFARVGYRGATMAAISREARCSTPTLYAYFRSKERLVEALLDRTHAAFMASFETGSPPQADFAARVTTLLARLQDLTLRHRAIMQVFVALQTGRDSLPARAARKWDTGFGEFMARMAAWLEDARGAKGARVSPHAAEDLAWFLWGTGHAFHLRALRGDSSLAALAELGPKVAELFLHGAVGSRSGRR